MKRAALVGITLATIGCNPPKTIDIQRVSVSAINAVFSSIPASKNGILSFDLLIRNEGSVPAQVGCGMAITRQSDSSAKTVVQPACSLPDWKPQYADNIPPATTDTIKVRVNLHQEDFDEMAAYRAIPLIAFGPEFRVASGFASEPFRVVRNAEPSGR